MTTLLSLDPTRTSTLRRELGWWMEARASALMVDLTSLAADWVVPISLNSWNLVVFDHDNVKIVSKSPASKVDAKILPTVKAPVVNLKWEPVAAQIKLKAYNAFYSDSKWEEFRRKAYLQGASRSHDDVDMARNRLRLTNPDYYSARKKEHVASLGGKRRSVRNVFCPTGEGGGVDPSCGVGGIGHDAIWEKPNKEQLDRAHVVFKQLSDGPASKYLEIQMHGAIVKNGIAIPLTNRTKLMNLKKLDHELHEIKRKDPEAFEAARQWSLADELGYKNYAEIPNVISVYRGHNESEKLPGMTNVSHSLETAKTFGTKLYMYQINKKDVGWVMQGASSFKEGEMLVFDTKKFKSVIANERLVTNLPSIKVTDDGPSQAIIDRLKQQAKEFADLEDVTEDMAKEIEKILVEGLEAGKSPLEMAEEIEEQVEIGKAQAERIARTEIIEAYAEGQLDSMEALGVEGVEADVEFSDTGDEKVCPECEDLEGRVFSIEEARGVIPVHPNCRCAWVPAVPSPDEGEKLVKNMLFNMFCPTGKGGC